MARARAGRAPAATDRLLVRIDDGLYELVELDDVYHLETGGHDTLVRTRSKRRRRSTETLAQLLKRLPRPPFFQCHRSHAINLRRVRQVRLRETGDWEVRLDPPVNVVVPVGRTREKELFELLGGR